MNAPKKCDHCGALDSDDSLRRFAFDAGRVVGETLTELDRAREMARDLLELAEKIFHYGGATLFELGRITELRRQIEAWGGPTPEEVKGAIETAIDDGTLDWPARRGGS